MTGWKTKLGAAGAILTGLGMVIAGFLANPIDGDMLTRGFTAISGGIIGVGIAHKIEKSSK
jgi:hypothetical protein